jgi:hypothetical protein
MALADLAKSYTREEIVWQLREKRLELLPIKVGAGPFDLDPQMTDPCLLCGEYLIDRVDGQGNVSAIGLGLYAKSRWLVMHPTCARNIEEETT